MLLFIFFAISNAIAINTRAYFLSSYMRAYNCLKYVNNDKRIAKASLGEIALEFSLAAPLGLDLGNLTLSVKAAAPGGQADELGVAKG